MHHAGEVPPEASNPVRKRNYRVILIDGGVLGITGVAGVFMPVFIVRLGGSNLEVSLLTALPALTGFLFAIPIGTFLQSRRNVVPWYARARGSAQMVYVATAAASALVAPAQAVLVTLILWGAITIPSTIGAVAFNVVMDGAAGPRGRYDLLSMRWSVMGLATAVSVAVAGQILQLLPFPLNYQLVFVSLSVAGFFSFWFSRQIRIADHLPSVRPPGDSIPHRLRGFVGMIRGERRFVSFVGRHFLLTFGSRLAAPLIPLWYVREAHAPDSWIGVIGMAQSLALLLGYSFWRGQSRRRSARILIVSSTVGLALYPGLLSLSTDLLTVAVITGASSLFAAGVDLVLFDELMKTIPRRLALTLSSVETSTQNLAAIVAPLLGGLIAELAGIQVGLLVAAVVTLAGALGLSLIRPPAPPPEPTPAT